MTNSLTPLDAYKQLLNSACTQEQLFEVVDKCSNIDDLEALLKRLEKDGLKSSILYDFIVKKIAYLRSPKPANETSGTISITKPTAEKIDLFRARQAAFDAAKAGLLLRKGWGNNGGGQPPI